MKKLTIRIPDYCAEFIEKLVKNGEYATKSEVVRASIREFMKEYRKRG